MKRNLGKISAKFRLQISENSFQRNLGRAKFCTVENSAEPKFSLTKFWQNEIIYIVITDKVKFIKFLQTGACHLGDAWSLVQQFLWCSDTWALPVWPGEPFHSFVFVAASSEQLLNSNMKHHSLCFLALVTKLHSKLLVFSVSVIRCPISWRVQNVTTLWVQVNKGKAMWPGINQWQPLFSWGKV